MKLDVKILLVGLTFWVAGSIAIPLAIDHRTNLDLLPTTADVVYHWLGISGLVLILAGSLAVMGASVALSGRFPPAKACIAGFAFWIPAGLFWLVTRTIVSHTYTWVFLLVPWFVAIFSGALLVIVGLARFAVSKLQQ